MHRTASQNGHCDGKKEYCNKELDSADDKKKVLEKGQSDLETAIVDAKAGIVTTKAEIEALDDIIKAALETEAQPEAQPEARGSFEAQGPPRLKWSFKRV